MLAWATSSTKLLQQVLRDGIDGIHGTVTSGVGTTALQAERRGKGFAYGLDLGNSSSEEEGLVCTLTPLSPKFVALLKVLHPLAGKVGLSPVSGFRVSEYWQFQVSGFWQRQICDAAVGDAPA